MVMWAENWSICVGLIDMIAWIVLLVLPRDLEVLPPTTTHRSFFQSQIGFLHSGRMAKFLCGQCETRNPLICSLSDIDCVTSVNTSYCMTHAYTWLTRMNHVTYVNESLLLDSFPCMTHSYGSCHVCEWVILHDSLVFTTHSYTCTWLTHMHDITHYSWSTHIPLHHSLIYIHIHDSLIYIHLHDSLIYIHIHDSLIYIHIHDSLIYIHIHGSLIYIHIHDSLIYIHIHNSLIYIHIQDSLICMTHSYTYIYMTHSYAWLTHKYDSLIYTHIHDSLIYIHIHDSLIYIHINDSLICMTHSYTWLNHIHTNKWLTHIHTYAWLTHIHDSLIYIHIQTHSYTYIYMTHSYTWLTHLHNSLIYMRSRSDVTWIIHLRDTTYSYQIQQHIATQCNTLQHTATHCNTKEWHGVGANVWSFHARFTYMTRYFLPEISSRCIKQDLEIGDLWILLALTPVAGSMLVSQFLSFFHSRVFWNGEYEFRSTAIESTYPTDIPVILWVGLI